MTSTKKVKEGVPSYSELIKLVEENRPLEFTYRQKQKIASEALSILRKEAEQKRIITSDVIKAVIIDGKVASDTPADKAVRKEKTIKRETFVKTFGRRRI